MIIPDKEYNEYYILVLMANICNINLT